MSAFFAGAFLVVVFLVVAIAEVFLGTVLVPLALAGALVVLVVVVVVVLLGPASFTGPDGPSESRVSMTVREGLSYTMHTLWTRENAGFRALGKGTVELGRELGVGNTTQIVVRLHILLDGLTAVHDTHISKFCPSLCRKSPVEEDLVGDEG